MSARVLIAFLALSLAGCACCDDAQAPPPASGAAEQGEASVQGTVVDAATRAPVPGAEVTAPDGSRARSDGSGRFRIAGLAPGLEGELVAEGPDGGVGRVRLRALRSGPLEVVVHLRSP